MNKKHIIFYVILGILHPILTVYMPIHINGIPPKMYFMRKRVWAFLIALVIIVFCIIRKYNNKEKFYKNFLIAVITTTLSSALFAIISLFFLFDTSTW